MQPDGTTAPGGRVRLKYGYVAECTGFDRADDGGVARVHARIVPDTKSGTPGADAVKVKGTIGWVAACDAMPATVHLYEHLFKRSTEGDSRTTVRGPQFANIASLFVAEATSCPRGIAACKFSGVYQTSLIQRIPRPQRIWPSLPEHCNAFRCVPRLATAVTTDPKIHAKPGKTLIAPRQTSWLHITVS